MEDKANTAKQSQLSKEERPVHTNSWQLKNIRNTNQSNRWKHFEVVQDIHYAPANLLNYLKQTKLLIPFVKEQTHILHRKEIIHSMLILNNSNHTNWYYS